jgi:GNAT superfamily N-acetyltransferase
MERAGLVRRIEVGEFDAVIEVYAQTAAWLTSMGIEQWDDPPHPKFVEHIRREIEIGNVYGMRLSVTGELVGVMRFEWEPGVMWPNDYAAGYVYSLAIRPAHHGKTMGEAMLQWAEDHVRRMGRKLIRLDCVAHNDKLRAYYLRLGYNFCGIGQAGGDDFALFEKRVN